MAEFQEFGATLAIGAFAVAVAAAFGYLLFALDLPHRFGIIHQRDATKGPKETSRVTLLFLAAGMFGVGMVAENLSNQVVDRKQPPCWMHLTLLYWCPLPAESTLRTDVLFPCPPEQNKDGFAVQFAERKLLSRYSSHSNHSYARHLEILILQRELSCTSVPNERKEDIADRMYYVAKNTVVPQYGDEMDKIQLRIDFARSLAVVTAVCFSVGALLSLLQMALVWAKVLKSRERLSKPEQEGRHDRLGWLHVPQIWPFPGFDLSGNESTGCLMAILAGRDACILLALGIVFFLARSAYTAEEREFGKRAYGYFVTLDEESLPSFGEFVEGSTASNESSPVNGTRVPAISGMAKFDHAFYLLVHDVKTDVDGPRKEPTEPRMRVLSFCDLKLRIADVVVQWGEHDPASDLEAVCVVPGKAREFWTAESRYYKGQFGRLMRVELGHSKDGWRGTLLEVVALPENLGDEVEGLLCLPRESSNLLILALRGGGRNPGKLVWGHVKESRFEQTGERTIELDDTVFSARDELRRCTALFLSSDDIIWGSAASDPGTFGPFVSYIYKIGAVDEILRSAAGQKTINEYQAVLAGLKVEALSSAPFVADLSIGTDDESFGGIWRPVAIPTSTAASRADDQP